MGNKAGAHWIASLQDTGKAKTGAGVIWNKACITVRYCYDFKVQN
jgi:hypothetical protein